MWIRTQSRRILVNTDNVNLLFVSNDYKSIKARIVNVGSDEQEYITLGEYKDGATCLKILEHLLLVVGSDILAITMPLDEEIDEWSKKCIQSCYCLHC